MEELIKLAGVGGIAGLVFIIFKYLDNKYVDSKQKKLEARVSEIKQKESELAGEQKIEDQQTRKEVDAISKEQDKPLTGDDLASWFNRRK